MVELLGQQVKEVCNAKFNTLSSEKL